MLDIDNREEWLTNYTIIYKFVNSLLIALSVEDISPYGPVHLPRRRTAPNVRT